MDKFIIDKNDRFAVLGAGRSGIAAASLLLAHDAKVMLFDDALESDLKLYSTSNIKDHPNLVTRFGKENFDLEHVRALILSPGVPLDHNLVTKVKSLKIPLLNEIDLAYCFLPPCKIIGITGTNGKSTTTVMIENILRSAKKHVWAGGNLGSPLSLLALKQESHDYVVLELSSFQLETLKMLRLDIAIILNMTPDHLDRYDSVNDYYQAKMGIIKLLKSEGTLIINDSLKPLETKAELKYFSNSSFGEGELSFLGALEIAGEHNRENATAAALCALSLSVKKEAILEGLLTFKPLPHRCELVAKKAGITFINDSKGTTVEAVKKALSMTKGPVHLLLGGLAKGEDFSALSPRYFSSVAGYYVFGHAKAQILAELTGAKTLPCENMREAFQSALKNAQAGHTILLSPGCASYDQFKDFNERGEIFRELVNNVAENMVENKKIP